MNCILKWDEYFAAAWIYMVKRKIWWIVLETELKKMLSGSNVFFDD